MRIGEVCELCDLTKKAIAYYERQGLIHPRQDENGYRNYTDEEVRILKEISLLRKIGIAVADIYIIVNSVNRSDALYACMYKMDQELCSKTAQLDCVKQLVLDYDVERGTLYADEKLARVLPIRQKLIEAFPGIYGIYLDIHFGQFLDVAIDTRQKQEAYQCIIDYLDQIPDLIFPPEVEDLLSELAVLQRTDMEQMHQSFMDAVMDIESFMQEKGDVIEQYYEIRTSQEFQGSPAGLLRKSLLDFQRSSGYEERFLENLKILSPAYTAYVSKLQEANDKFLRQYPQMEEFE